MKKLLFQVCCAPCGTYTSYESLAPRFDLVWYFCNPNLVDKVEYDRRLEAVISVTQRFGWPLIIEPYEHENWRNMTCGRGADPERGPRCQLCYRDRLIRTAQLAVKKGCDAFGTSLLVSPYKDAAGITAIGSSVAGLYGVDFLAEDFQANGGYEKSRKMAVSLGLYRQKFCGCEYSLPPALAHNILTNKRKAYA